MKTILNLSICMIALCMLCTTTQAQERQQRLNREQLAEAQARHIAKEMAMDDTTSTRFIDAYCNFQKEIWALGPRYRQFRDSSMTDEENEEAIKARFVHSQKILDIRKKYYGIYSEFLTATQIRQVYDLERQMMNRLSRRNQGKRASR